MNYKVGDTVVCIDAKPVFDTDVPRGLVLGNKYVVKGFQRSCCTEIVDVGLTKSIDHPQTGICQICLRRFWAADLVGFQLWRFVKLDGLQQETETCTDVELAENV